MKHLVLQLLLVLGGSSFFIKLAEASEIRKSLGDQDCYELNFVEGDIQVRSANDSENPELVIRFQLPTGTQLNTTLMPSLETSRSNNCTVYTWKSATSLSDGASRTAPTQPSQIRISLSNNINSLTIANLKGTIEVATIEPQMKLFLRNDQGRMRVSHTQVQTLELAQTQGAITTESVEMSQMNIRAEQSIVALRDVTSRDRKPQILVNVKHGQVTAQNVFPFLDIHTFSASVTTVQTQNIVKIQTRTGAIQTSGAMAPIEISSVSGTIDSRFSQESVSGVSQLTSQEGPIRLWVNAAINAKIEAESLSLPIDSEIEGKAFGSKKIFPLNLPNHRILAKTSSGPIVIKKF